MKRRIAARSTFERRRRLAIEFLEDRRLLYGPVEAEPNDSLATALDIAAIGSFPTSEFVSLFGSGSIAPNDQDFWRFSALAGDSIAISVDTPDKILNPRVELQNSAGGVLTSNDDSGPGTDSLSVFLVASSGTYFVRVRGANASTTGGYQVRVDLARGVSMESDLDYSNDSTGGANPLTLTNVGNTRTASIAGTIMGSESGNFDEDRFQLGLLNAGRRLTSRHACPNGVPWHHFWKSLTVQVTRLPTPIRLMESSPVSSPSTVPTSPAFVRQEQSLTAACTRTTQPARAGPLLKPQQ